MYLASSCTSLPVVKAQRSTQQRIHQIVNMDPTQQRIEMYTHHGSPGGQSDKMRPQEAASLTAN